MHPVCSCGTELPEGARFCFRCGKPQRAEDIEVFAPPSSPAPPALPPPEAPGLTSVSFGNPVALRTALFIACLITGLEIFPPFLVLAPLIGGFAAVLLFQKRTGRVLTTGAAVKLGWITAILNATLGTIALTATAVMEGGATFLEPLRESIRQQATSPAQQQAIQMMNDPFFLGIVVLMAWLLYFVLISGLCIAGGALGARLARPRTS